MELIADITRTFTAPFGKGRDQLVARKRQMGVAEATRSHIETSSLTNIEGLA